MSKKSEHEDENSLFFKNLELAKRIFGLERVISKSLSGGGLDATDRKIVAEIQKKMEKEGDGD